MIKIIKQLLNLLTSKEKKSLFIIIFLVVFCSLLESLTVAFLFPIINVLQNPNIENSGYYIYLKSFLNFSYKLDFKIELILCFFLFIILKSLTSYFITTKQISFIGKINKRLANELYISYINLPFENYLSSKSSRFIRNLTVEINNLFNFILNPLLSLISELILLFSILVILFIINFTVSSFLIIIFILFYFTYVKNVRTNVLKLGKENQNNNNLLIKSIQETFSGIREIKLFNLNNYFQEKIYKILLNLNNGVTKNLIFASLPRIILDFVFYTFFVSILIYSYINNTIKEIFPLISAFAAAGIKIMPGINKIINSYTSINFGAASLNEISNEISLGSKKKHLNTDNFQDNIDFKNNIEFNNISYQYPNTNKKVLDSINFSIKYKKLTAIIGESGSGKTTLMHIILGLLNHDTGNIFSNSKEIFLNNKLWHQNVGYLPQNVFIADDTIKNNITLFKENDHVDEILLADCIKLAQLDKLVNSKIENVDFKVGERGSKLSGGEIQRIGIARLLYNKKKIIVFDEPTSALDAVTELEIIDTIVSLKDKYTLIIVTHNQSLINKVDISYKIDKSGIKQIK